MESALVYCSLCTMKFETQEKLQIHLTIHHQQQLSQEISLTQKTESRTCAICQLTYETSEALSAHVASHHAGVSDNKELTGLEGLAKLSGFDRLSLITEFSSKKFPLIASQWCAKSDVTLLSDTISKQSFSCTKCRLKFPCEKALYIHAKSHIYPTGINCKECDCDFEDENSYAYHTMTKHIPHTILNSMKTSEGEEDVHQDVPTLNKEGFMIMCGLKKKSDTKLLSGTLNTAQPELSTQIQQAVMLKVMQQKETQPNINPATTTQADISTNPDMNLNLTAFAAAIKNNPAISMMFGPRGFNPTNPQHLDHLKRVNNVEQLFMRKMMSEQMMNMMPGYMGIRPAMEQSGHGMRLPHVVAGTEQRQLICCKHCLETFHDKHNYMGEKEYY